MPEASTPSVEKISLPMMVATTSTKMGSACSSSSAGFTSMPTETKKTAPKRSLMGAIRCSIFSALGASAISEPMMKAPSAEEKPRCVASTTMPRHRPIATMTSVSSFIRRCAHLKKLGTRYMPSTNQSTRKNTRRPMLSSSSSEDTFVVATASVASSTIMIMPAISSTMRMPKTTSVKRCARIFKSSKALMMIVVDDMASMPPRKRLSI